MSLSWECKCMTIPLFHWVVGCVCNHWCSELETVFVHAKYASEKRTSSWALFNSSWWEARNSIKCTKCVFCGTALVLSDTLFCVLDVASLIDSKILNSMISRRCRVLTCPCCFFLLIMLFVCFSPGLKKNLPGNYLKIKTQRKQYQNPCFSTSKSHQAASNWVAKSHILFGSDL